MITACIWAIYYSDWLIINKITIEADESNLDTDTGFLENYFGNVYGQNIVRFNGKAIQEQILAEQTGLESIDIKKIFPHTLKIQFKERALAANIINVSKENEVRKFIINTNGYIAKIETENPNLMYIRIKTEESFQPGDLVISTEYLHYIIKSIAYFEEKFDMKIIEVTFKNIEQEIQLKTEKNFSVWMDLNLTYQSQLEKLRKVAGKLDIYNSPLEYIDLRISGATGDKIIYKKRK